MLSGGGCTWRGGAGRLDKGVRQKGGACVREEFFKEPPCIYRIKCSRFTDKYIPLNVVVVSPCLRPYNYEAEGIW